MHRSLPLATKCAAAAFALGALCSAAFAQDRRVPASAAELQLSFAPVVKRVAPAVVNVYAARVVENRNPFMNDPLFRQFFGAVPREQVLRSLGSGVIIDPAGLVVTNYHVIEGASEVKVALSDKREFDAEIALKDVRIADREDLHHDDCRDAIFEIDPIESVVDSAPGEASGRAEAFDVLGVDEKGQTPFLDLPGERLDLERQ